MTVIESGRVFRPEHPVLFPIDSNGNLTSKTEGTDVWAYEWNAENELVRVTKNSVEQARFAYDPMGRRVEKVAAGVTTMWTYDKAGTDFQFGLSLSDGRFVYRRDQEQVELRPDFFGAGAEWTTIVEWSPTLLRIGSGCSAANARTTERATAYTIAPASLFRLARQQKLLPTTTFKSTDELRALVYQALADMKDAIERRAAQASFWDRQRGEAGDRSSGPSADEMA